MPSYDYVAQRRDGRMLRSSIVATNPQVARQTIVQQGLRLFSLQLKGEEPGSSQPMWDWMRWEGYLFKPSPRQLELLVEQMAVMLESGLPLVTALRHCEQTFANRSIRRLCGQLATAIDGGAAFADAIAESKALPGVVGHLIAVGEASGKLPQVLRQGAEFMARRRETRSGLIGALAYPTLVAVAATSVAIYLVGWVIPKLAGMLATMGRTMPPMTQNLIDLSTFIRAWGTEMSLVGLGAVGTVVTLYLRKSTRPLLDRWILKLPMLGAILRMAEAQFLSAALALMLRSGVCLQDAMRTVAKTHRNQYLGGIVAASVQRLARGETLTESLRGFDPLLCSLVSVGEQTGELSRALEHVAVLYTCQLDSSLKRLSRVLEPAIIIVAGGAVGYVYAAFFMALMSTGANFK